jgi:hypothetical protein
VREKLGMERTGVRESAVERVAASEIREGIHEEEEGWWWGWL